MATDQSEERLRRQLVAELDLLDRPQDGALRAVAELAAAMCGTPMASVALVDADRQYFAGAVGMPVRETERDGSFCALAIEQPDRPLLVPDATADPRFTHSRLVTGEAHVRSYAGVPLMTPEGVAVGALCVFDRRPRSHDDVHVERLRVLATVTTDLLQARRTAHRLASAAERLTEAQLAEREAMQRFRVAFEHAPTGMALSDASGTFLQVNAAFAAMVGSTVEAVRGLTLGDVVAGPDLAGELEVLARLAAGGEFHVRETTFCRLDGRGRVDVPAVVTSSLMEGHGDRPALLLHHVVPGVIDRRQSELRAELVRYAASTANAAATLDEAAPPIIDFVCAKLGWVAGDAWVTDDAEATRLCLDDDPRPNTVTVPILLGDAAGGVLTFWLPDGAERPEPRVITALELIGTHLGRVVERERAAALLSFRASHDPLTHLANKEKLLDEIRAAIAADPPDMSPSTQALFIIDLDRFRLVTDSLGHDAGDVLLREIASRLREVTAASDIVARLDADQFAVFSRSMDESDPLEAVAGRLLDAVQGRAKVAGHHVHVRASIGTCRVDAVHAADPEVLLRDADTALRLAKTRGRSRIEVFDTALRIDAAQRLADETALHAAVAGHQLRLHYQPVMGLHSGRPVGAEALVRWERPDHGLVPPSYFVPLAEETGLIVEMGRWVLNQACADAARWRNTRSTLADTTVSVNVSARQLGHPEFLEHLDDALSASGLPPHKLTLEITESMLLEDREATLDLLQRIRASGIRTALDDFGTGFSSMGRLHDVPVDILKIDKSFVDPIVEPGKGTAMAEAIQKLADAVGLHTVAEGVETLRQAAALRRLGCHLAQGYAFARPAPLGALEAALDAGAVARVRA